MEFKLEGQDLKDILHKAVIDALGETGKEALLKEVVQYLTTERQAYDRAPKVSPLLQALHDAATGAARDYFTKRIEIDNEFAETLERLYLESVKKFTSVENTDKLTTKMAERLSAAFNTDRY